MKEIPRKHTPLADGPTESRTLARRDFPGRSSGRAQPAPTPRVFQATPAWKPRLSKQRRAARYSKSQAKRFTTLSGAHLDGACVFGISAWRLKLDRATQSDLIITPEGELT